MSSKMRVIYIPEGGSRRSWVVDLRNPAWDVQSMTERATGWPWLEFSDRLGNGSGIAVQALLWVLRKRDEPRLELDAVRPMDPTMSLLDEIDFEEIPDEPPEEPAPGEA